MGRLVVGLAYCSPMHCFSLTLHPACWQDQHAHVGWAPDCSGMHHYNSMAFSSPQPCNACRLPLITWCLLPLLIEPLRAGMFMIMGTLLALDRFSKQGADKVQAFFNPALNWIQRWLPLFYVPTLVVLPQAIQGIGGMPRAAQGSCTELTRHSAGEPWNAAGEYA